MNCIICLPVRNCEIYLDKIYDNIKTVQQAFSELTVVFFYDKSSDNTLDKLYELKSKYNGKFDILINKNDLLQYRTHRIAYARNELILHVKNNYSNKKFFIMMDSDEICCYKIDIKTLEYYLPSNSWDALSFNRSGLPDGHENYDMWALLYEPFIHHCHSYNGDLSVVFIMRDDITKKLNSLKKDELFECYSAFNGFAIYRTEKFLNCQYDGEKQIHFPLERINDMLKFINNTYNKKLKINFDYVSKDHGGGKQICEHLNFHLDAIRKNNARIRISGEKIFVNL